MSSVPPSPDQGEYGWALREFRRKDYSQHIMPLKHSVKLKRIAGPPDHPFLLQDSCASPTKPEEVGFLLELHGKKDAVERNHLQSSPAYVLLSLNESRTYRFSYSQEKSAQNIADSLVVRTAAGVNAVLVIDINTSEFHSNITECFLAPGSSLTLVTIQRMKSGIYAGKHFFRLQENSSLKVMHLDIGADVSMLEQRAILSGGNASVRNYSSAFKSGNQKCDFNIESVHESEKTNSDIDSAVLLEESSFMNARTLVQINPKASNCEGFEKVDALLLSDSCRISAVPDLLIHNNNVVCTHSVAISRLDREKKFYLMSRGVSEGDAVLLLKEAFIKNQIDKAGMPAEELEKLGGLFGNV